MPKTSKNRTCRHPRNRMSRSSYAIALLLLTAGQFVSNVTHSAPIRIPPHRPVEKPPFNLCEAEFILLTHAGPDPRPHANLRNIDRESKMYAEPNARFQFSDDDDVVQTAIVAHIGLRFIVLRVGNGYYRLEAGQSVSTAMKRRLS